MATNNAANFNGDIGKLIAKKTLPLATKDIIVSQFGTKMKFDRGYGTTYTATRYERVNLPFASLAEGVAAGGESMTITQVTGTAAQWGDLIRLTDVAELTIYHPVFEKAQEVLRYQIAETVERNTFSNLNGGTQVNYAGAVGSRAALGSGNVLSPHEVNRAFGTLRTLGARQYNGTEGAQDKKTVASGAMGTGKTKAPHFVAVIHPLVEQDMRENAAVQNAWNYSDVDKLYNQELGQWGGIRFTSSNMVPSWTGVAAVAAGTASNSGGSLATGTYIAQFTGMPITTSVESNVYQVSTGVAVTGPNGSLSVTAPTLPGYVFNVYIGTTSTPTNLALSASGPTSGPLAGQAVQIASGATVVLTGVGLAQTPPAAPTTGITVFPTYIFGKDSFGQLELDGLKVEVLKDADKSDPMNQTRVVSWKMFYGTMIVNNAFFMRIEAASAFAATFG